MPQANHPVSDYTAADSWHDFLDCRNICNQPAEQGISYGARSIPSLQNLPDVARENFAIAHGLPPPRQRAIKIIVAIQKFFATVVLRDDAGRTETSVIVAKTGETASSPEYSGSDNIVDVVAYGPIGASMAGNLPTDSTPVGSSMDCARFYWSMKTSKHDRMRRATQPMITNTPATRHETQAMEMLRAHGPREAFRLCLTANDGLSLSPDQDNWNFHSPG